MRAYTVAQISAAEQVALQRVGQLPLMRRAADAVTAAALHLLGVPRRGRRVVLLVGVGNNGGDALFAGAGLARRGIRVVAVCTDPSRVHAAGGAALLAAGGALVETAEAAAELAAADLIIDGLVGIGAVPPLRPAAAQLAEWAGTAPGRRLAVDLPSGVHPDLGTHSGSVFRADVTVTFGGAKTGLLISAATGLLIVHQLGFPLAGGPFDAVSLDDESAEAMLPRPGTDAGKYTNGVLGVAAGSSAYPGAAVLCTGGAVRTRPGMVRFAGGHGDGVVARWPEVVATPDVGGAGRVQAWVVGPGLGVDDTGVRTLHEVMQSDVPVLVDADGLRLVAAEPELLAERRRRGVQTVLTPHQGEFGALFPDLDPAERLASTRTAAARCGATVLLKGHRTIVATPAGETSVNTTATPWLSTAGSGDVLSGVIGSLLAAGLSPFDAATLGAFLHGRAGLRAERSGIAGAQALWDHLR